MSFNINIQKKFKDFNLDIRLSSEQGIVGLLGKSGAGKSLTLSCIAGIVTPDKGIIQINGKTLFDSENKINLPVRRRKIGYLFQNAALFPNMTVKQNCVIAAKNKEVAQQQLKEYLSLLGMQGSENKFPHELSGGQKQRVALIRALIQNADILLLDEPFSALDTVHKREIEAEFISVLQSRARDVIYVSHDVRELYCASQKLAVISEGVIAACGTTQELFCSPTCMAAAKSFGCRNFVTVDESKTAFGAQGFRQGQIAGVYEKNVRVYKDIMQGINAKVLSVTALPDRDTLELLYGDNQKIYATAPKAFCVKQNDVLSFCVKKSDIFTFVLQN